MRVQAENEIKPVSVRSEVGNRVLLLVLAGLFLFACISSAQPLSEIDSPIVELTEGWKYRWGDSPFDPDGVPRWTYGELNSQEWKPSPRKLNTHRIGGYNIIWYRIKLPRGTWQAPGILIPRVFLSFEVYLDGDRIYSFGKWSSSRNNRFSPFVLHRIPLPENFQGKNLFFRIRSDLTQLIGIEGKVHLGSNESLMMRIMRISLSYVFLGSFFVLIGFLCFLVFLVQRAIRSYAILNLGLFTFFIGTAFLSSLPITQILVSSPQFLYFGMFISFLIFPIGLLAFVEQVIGAGFKSIIRRLWQFHLVIAGVALALEISGVLSLANWMGVLQYLWLLDMAACVWTSIHAAVKGSVEARIFTAGVGVFSLFASHDLIRRGDIGLMQWGTLIFILLLGYLLLLRFVENSTQLQIYSRELEEKSENLEAAKGQLEAYSQTLEHKVEERTSALKEKNVQLEDTLTELRDTQNQLVIREKMASLGHLVAGVAHEINNPVGAVHSAADVSRRSFQKIVEILSQDKTLGEIKSDKTYQKAMEILESNIETAYLGTERISTIVQSLRRFARLDEAEYQETDIHECLDTTLTLLHHELKKRITVVKDYGDVPRIQSYAGELNQVFMNVLANAAQAVEGEGTVRIRTRADEKQIMIEISDSGIGMTPDQLSRIFDPGFTTKGVGVGTGLGLSISYNIIQQHGGSIKAESRPGQGAVFSISLPLRSRER